MDNSSILAKYIVLPTYAECALAPFSPSSYGICSIINRLTIDSIANPHLNGEPGTIITFLDEMFGLAAGPAGLFIGSFLASTLLPGGSEAMLLWALQQRPDQGTLLWSAATLGNTLGGLSSWLIGWWLARRFPGSGLKDERQRQALQRVTRYGSPILLLSWLPVIGDPLCLAAGWSGVRLIPATLLIGLGKALRYSVVLAAFSS